MGDAQLISNNIAVIIVEDNTPPDKFYTHPDEHFNSDDWDDWEIPSCSICGSDLEWVECNCDDGFIHETEIDPLEGDDLAICPDCNGQGGWLECSNVQNHGKGIDPDD